MSFSLRSNKRITMAACAISMLFFSGCMPGGENQHARTPYTHMCPPLPAAMRARHTAHYPHADNASVVAPMQILSSHCHTAMTNRHPASKMLPAIPMPLHHKIMPRRKRMPAPIHTTKGTQTRTQPPHFYSKAMTRHSGTTTHTAPHPMWRTVTPSHFDAIHATGALILQIKGGKRAHVAVSHYAIGQPMPVISTKNHTLHIHAPAAPKSPGNRPYHPAMVKITVPILTALSVDGAVRVQGKNLRTTHLVLEDNSRRAVTLDGFLDITDITHRGQGNLDIKWVKAQKLYLTASAGRTQLAGKVASLYINGSRNATIDTRHTRAKRVWVQSQDSSRVHVLAKAFLHAQAQDLSKIAYYKTPLHPPLIHTRDYATVLQHDAWR